MKNRPFYLWPCIWVYRVVRIPFYFLKYFSLGLFVILYAVTSLFTTLLKPMRYVLYGFIVICNFIYQIVNMITIRIPVYMFIGITVVLFLIRQMMAKIGQGTYDIFIKVFDKILGWDIDNKDIKAISDALITSNVIKDDNLSKMFYSAKGEFSETPHTEVYVFDSKKVTQFLEKSIS